MDGNQDFTFKPFRERESQWDPNPNHKPLIPNVATVLPPDLPEPILRTLLLRMQLEEAFYKLNHLDEETEYAIWRENSLDGIWQDRIKDAAQSRAREVLSYEIRQIVHSIDETFPPILPPPPAPQGS